MCELILADPSLGLVQLLKLDISNEFYQVNLNIDNVTKLGVAFPTKPSEHKLLALSLVLSIGLEKQSAYIFSSNQNHC